MTKQHAFAWHGGDQLPNWSTPWPMFREIERRFAWGGSFSVDLAAEAWNAKVAKYISPEQDMKACAWGDPRNPERGFLNPVFDDIGAMFRPIPEQLEHGNIEQAICYVPNRSDRKWWARIVRPYARRVVEIEGRQVFEPPPGYAGKVSSHGEPMVVICFERAFHAIGWTPAIERVAPLLDLISAKETGGSS